MIDNKENLKNGFNMMGNSMAKMWDMWLVGLGSISGTQDQIVNMTIKRLNQSKTAQEELLKVGENLSQQVRKNQAQLQDFMVETVMKSYEQVNYTNQNLISELSKKVADLSNYKGGELADQMMTPLKQWLAATAGSRAAD